MGEVRGWISGMMVSRVSLQALSKRPPNRTYSHTTLHKELYSEGGS